MRPAYIVLKLKNNQARGKGNSHPRKPEISKYVMTSSFDVGSVVAFLGNPFEVFCLFVFFNEIYII